MHPETSGKIKTDKSIPEQDISFPLSSYSPDQKSIILGNESVKQVVAAAGSGKTRTVIGYVEYRLERNEDYRKRVLLLSFSRKAAGEIKERFSPAHRDCVEISTFHSFCFRRLREYHPDFIAGDVNILPEEEKISVVTEFLRENSEIIGGIPFSLIMKEQKWFQEKYPELHGKLLTRIEEYKVENNLLEYDDLISIMLDGLRKNVEWVKGFLFRYRLIIVDEFQDTDPDQLEFLQLMNADELLVVGDDYQAIYSFRGATVQPFLDFRKHFRGTKIYRLSTNYRSYREIIDSAGSIIKSSSRQLRKRVIASRGAGGRFTVIFLYISPGEESYLLHYLKDKDIRILTRSNTRLRFWRKNGVPEKNAMTVHRSKGLEFPIVFLDMTSGWESQKRLETIDDEEIRIAYVGMTRAMNRLVILLRPGQEDNCPWDRMWGRLAKTARSVVNPAELNEYII